MVLALDLGPTLFEHDFLVKDHVLGGVGQQAAVFRAFFTPH